MKIEVNPMLFPGYQVDHLIIKEETRDEYFNVLVLRKKNIVLEWEFYQKWSCQFYRLVYVKTGYGIIKGRRIWSNESGPVNLKYSIENIFQTYSEAEKDLLEIKKLFKDEGNERWTVCSGKNDKKILYENYDSSMQDNEPVECKSKDTHIMNFDIEYTNNLGVKFNIACRELYCLVRWIKYRGKIYRAVLYHTKRFGVQGNKGVYTGINFLTKSTYINHSSTESDLNKEHSMRMKRIWFVDEQLGGLSVRQYRRLRKKLYNAYKENYPFNIIPSSRLKEMDDFGTKDYNMDPSIYLYLDEVLKDITEKEKEDFLKIHYRGVRIEDIEELFDFES